MRIRDAIHLIREDYSRHDMLVSPGPSFTLDSGHLSNQPPLAKEHGFAFNQSVPTKAYIVFDGRS
jgi:hypothetical protein